MLPSQSTIASDSLTGWHERLSADRPIYGCPECKESSLQFFLKRADMPGRDEFFYCCACGLTWEVK
jgi:DNA-directed RNA polymerase subunit M/transcription elongation factor TFIIS